MPTIDLTIPPFVSQLAQALYFYFGSFLEALGCDVPPLPI